MSLREEILELRTKLTQIVGGVELENDVRAPQEGGETRKVTWDGEVYHLWWSSGKGYSTNRSTEDVDRAVAWLEGVDSDICSVHGEFHHPTTLALRGKRDSFLVECSCEAFEVIAVWSTGPPKGWVVADHAALVRAGEALVLAIYGPEDPIKALEILNRNLDDIKMAKEALKVLDRLLARGEGFPSAPKSQVKAPITVGVFADQFQKIEAYDLRVAHIFLNVHEFSDLQKWTLGSYIVESRAAMLKLGVMGTLWAATIITSEKVPAGMVWFTIEGRYLFPNPKSSDFSPLLDVVDTPAGLFNPYGMLELSVTR